MTQSQYEMISLHFHRNYDNRARGDRLNDRYWWKRTLILFGCLAICSSLALSQQPFSNKNSADERNNRISIRSALRITKTSRRPIVEIEVYSDEVFPVRNAMHVLQIGKRVFQMSRYGDTKGHVLIFVLTPEEFANTKTGEEVLVGYQGDESNKVVESPRNWKFGKLDKSKLDQ